MRIKVLMVLGGEEQGGTKELWDLEGERDLFLETETRIRSVKVVSLSHYN